MNIQPIITAQDHADALKQIETLWGSPVGTLDGDKLDVLITLIDHYEDSHFPIGSAHPIDVLKTHMEMSGRSQSDLAALFESVSRASEVLNLKRALTLDMIHKLNTLWDIPAEYLITPYNIRSPNLRLSRQNPAPKRTTTPAKKRA